VERVERGNMESLLAPPPDPTKEGDIRPARDLETKVMATKEAKIEDFMLKGCSR